MGYPAAMREGVEPFEKILKPELTVPIAVVTDICFTDATLVAAELALMPVPPDLNWSLAPVVTVILPPLGVTVWTAGIPFTELSVTAAVARSRVSRATL